jgi:predicted TIM-barrel fold metal-dependent hydrolase
LPNIVPRGPTLSSDQILDLMPVTIPNTKLREIREAISRLDFVFAKTMPHWPHEYTLRYRARDEADYVLLWQAIQEFGGISNWRGRPGPYLYPGDGWRYWDLTPKMNAKIERSSHINRAHLVHVKKLVEEGLVGEWKPKPPR